LVNARPVRRRELTKAKSGNIIAKPVLGGLHHIYALAALSPGWAFCALQVCERRLKPSLGLRRHLLRRLARLLAVPILPPRRHVEHEK
jgi:hypothetical protein